MTKRQTKWREKLTYGDLALKTGTCVFSLSEAGQIFGETAEVFANLAKRPE
jgi:hypothetical protein